MSATDSWMLCQSCGTRNPTGEEVCLRCQQQLVIVSGAAAGDGLAHPPTAEDNFSFDEHLLERISLLEEAVKRASQTARQLLNALANQERSILVVQTGLSALRDLLEAKGVVGGDEWRDLARTKLEYNLGALEKRKRFGAAHGRIRGLHRGDRKEVFERHLEDAEYAFHALDLERALESLEAAFKLDRGNYELAYLIGETWFNEGETKRALTYFGRVLAIDPEHFQALVYAGVVRHHRGEYQAAEELLERALSLQPEAFLPLFSLGAVLADQGRFRDAVRFLERAVAVDPVPHALFLLGRSLYELGRPGRAIRCLEKVVRLDPAFEEGHHLLGLAYLDRGWNRKALEAFRLAQRLNPKRLQYHDLVRHLSGQDRSILPAVEGEAARWLQRAESSLSGRNPENALASFRKAIGLAPDNPTLLMSYAVACLQLDHSEDSEAAVRRVLEGEPPELLRAAACATLMEALRVQGRYSEGNRVGRDLLERAESDFARTIAYYEMAFNLAELEEDLDRALDFARRSLELAPEELELFPLAALGWVHYKRRELDQAIEFLTRSTRIGASAEGLTHLGMALLDAGQEEKAREVLAEAREIGGRSISLEQKMMECVRDSGRLLEKIQEKRRK